MSSESLTFYNLFNRVDFIEIPILQRDYAQGRPEELEVRSLFLRSLFDALTKTNKKPLDLDFVYGNYENKGEGTEQKMVFSVLDGQQRLTTLFLLHWYLAQATDQIDIFKQHFVSIDGISRFTYKTRPSTSEFFNALVNCDLIVDATPISKAIRDSQWFYLSWQQDPTVQACLCMLDAIQQDFSGYEIGLFDQLTNSTPSIITFQFLNLQSFGLSDELYIKMNARGKPLTFFESFKAKLEQHISAYTQPWPNYHLSDKYRVVGGYDYFNHKIDTDWADLFWAYRNIRTEDNTFDDEFMNLFRFIIIIQSLLDNRKNIKKLNHLARSLFSSLGRSNNLSLSMYEELQCFSQALIIRFISIIDLIYKDGLENNKISPYLPNNKYYSEQKVFERVISNTTNYDDKLRFFAFYSYLSNNSNLEELEELMRVIYNLVENTITDSSADFYKALFVIDDLCQINNPILPTLKSGYELTVFSPSQILEEKIKAHLILRSDQWRYSILTAERHPFFKGQIGVILSFSGILSFFREYENCNWNDEQDVHYFNQFNRYHKSLSAVLDLISSNSSSIDYVWERAVLSKGNYCTSTTQNRLNLLHSRDSRNNIPRDHSWRRRLRIGSKEDEAKQVFIKAVLDDPLFNINNVKHSLEDICHYSLANDDLESWRHDFIKYPKVFAYCCQGFIVHDDKETVLLSQSQRNHYHCDLKLKVLSLQLSEIKDKLKPFSYIVLDDVKSREEHSKVRLYDCIVDGQSYQLVTKFCGETFDISFRALENNEYSEKVISVLLQNLEWEDVNSVTGRYFHIELTDIESVLEQILSLCSQLETLTK